MLVAIMAFVGAFTPPPTPAVARFTAAMTVSSTVPTNLSPHLLASSMPTITELEQLSSTAVLGGSEAWLFITGLYVYIGLYMLVAAALLVTDVELRAVAGDRLSGLLSGRDRSKALAQLSQRLIFAERRARLAAQQAAEEDAKYRSSWEAVEAACNGHEGCTIVPALSARARTHRRPHPRHASRRPPCLADGACGCVHGVCVWPQDYSLSDGHCIQVDQGKWICI